MPEPGHIAQRVLAELTHANTKHPNKRSLIEAAELIVDRAQDCLTAAQNSPQPNHVYQSGLRAVQTAALAFRLLQDNSIPLPMPPPNNT